jgi:hypothetical protein
MKNMNEEEGRTENDVFVIALLALIVSSIIIYLFTN